MWNNFVGIKFIFTIWRPSYGDFFFLVFIIVMSRFFYKLCYYTINERVQMNGFVFFFKNLKGYVRNIKGLNGWCLKDCRVIYRLCKQRIVKQNESNGNLKFIMTIGLKGISSSYWKMNQRQFQNGKEYARLIETPYRNLMLDRWILKTKEKIIGHKLFLSQEVVQCEIWIGAFHRKHNYRWQSPWKEM